MVGRRQEEAVLAAEIARDEVGRHSGGVGHALDRRVPVLGEPASGVLQDSPLGRGRIIGGTHLDELLDHWAKGYDWAVHERRIGGFPWVTVRAGDTDLRLIHQRSADPGAPVVVLLHGRPDSVLRFERVLPLLADMHVVVPALPGFPFAAPVTMPGMSANRIAGIVADALDELGYSRYTVSGGDVGGTVAEISAAEHPDRVAALHLTNVAPQRALTADPAKLGPDAAAYLGRSAQWFRTEGGYIAEQSTRRRPLRSLGTARNVRRRRTPCGQAGRLKRNPRTRSSGYGVSSSFPVVRRASRSSCARAASASG